MRAAFRAAGFRAPRAPIRAAVSGVAFCLLALGCGDTVKVTNVQPFTNQPPSIVERGPAYGPGPIDIARQGSPSLYVIVADPNGVSDIAETVFQIDTAIVHQMIVRQDSISPPYCAFVTYNPSDTVDILPLFEPTFTNVAHCLMSQERTFFNIAPFPSNPGFGYGCNAFPPIRTASSSFGPPLVGCVASEVDRLVSFGIYPPAASPPIEVSVTYLDVEYRGISATVYDASGVTATTRWPNLRLIYTTEKERTVAPGSRAAPGRTAFIPGNLLPARGAP